MDISKLKIFSMMQGNLSYLNERQDVLAQNIANANVPGYEAKDLKPMDFSKYLSNSLTATPSLGQTITNPAHITGTLNASNSAAASQKSKTGEITPTGNSVVVEDEVLKMSKNSMEYQQTTNLYRKMIDMLKTAIGNV